MEKLMQAVLRWGPALAVMLAIFWFSSIPAAQVSQAAGPVIARAPRTLPAVLPTVPPLRISWLKVGHAAGYALLGAAYLHAAGPVRRRAGLWAVLAAALYAVSDEFHQQFVPGRGAGMTDVLLDTASAAGAVLTFRLIQLAGRGEKGHG